jgi:hypothetical protein
MVINLQKYLMPGKEIRKYKLKLQWIVSKNRNNSINLTL